MDISTKRAIYFMGQVLISHLSFSLRVLLYISYKFDHKMIH